MGYLVVHFEINTASQSDLARFYEEAFGWTTHADGDDYLQINTNGVCAGTGEPGIEGGIGPSDPGDDFVTFYVQVPDVEETLAQGHGRGLVTSDRQRRRSLGILDR